MHKMFDAARAFNSDLSKWVKMFFFSLFFLMKNIHNCIFNTFFFLSQDVNNVIAMTNMFLAPSAFDRTICGNKWLSENVFVDGNGRSGCCDIGSYMADPHLHPFNATDGGGSCKACPSGWMSLNNQPNSNLNCTKCEQGKSSRAKSASCQKCARGRILTVVDPLNWYVIRPFVPFFVLCTRYTRIDIF